VDAEAGAWVLARGGIRVQEPATVTLLWGQRAAHRAPRRPCRARSLPPPPAARTRTRASPAAGNHRRPPDARARGDDQPHTRPPQRPPPPPRAAGKKPPTAHCGWKAQPPSPPPLQLGAAVSAAAAAAPCLTSPLPAADTRFVTPHGARKPGGPLAGRPCRAMGAAAERRARPWGNPAVHGAGGRPPVRRRCDDQYPPVLEAAAAGGRVPAAPHHGRRGHQVRAILGGARHGATGDDSRQGPGRRGRRRPPAAGLEAGRATSGGGRLPTATGVPREWPRPRTPPPLPRAVCRTAAILGILPQPAGAGRRRWVHPPPHLLLHPWGGGSMAMTRAAERGSPPMQWSGAAAAAQPVVGERSRHRRSAAGSATTLKTLTFDSLSQRDLAHCTADDPQRPSMDGESLPEERQEGGLRQLTLFGPQLTLMTKYWCRKRTEQFTSSDNDCLAIRPRPRRVLLSVSPAAPRCVSTVRRAPYRACHALAAPDRRPPGRVAGGTSPSRRVPHLLTTRAPAPRQYGHPVAWRAAPPPRAACPTH